MRLIEIGLIGMMVSALLAIIAGSLGLRLRWLPLVVLPGVIGVILFLIGILGMAP